MKVRLKPLSEQVIVITGASSGIGLATAQMAAAAGARVVLAARTESALNSAVQGIAATGGHATAVPCDVGRREDIEHLAAEAIRCFGRIDTWVNNAGVGIWGRIEEVSEADMRQLFEINFWGEVHGSLIALRHLKPHGGALINVGSMVSDRAVPLQGIYSASKHAIKGFTDALRMEIEEAGSPVSVTLIKPGSIGTPMPQHVKNYTNREPKFPPPVYAPEDVASAILRAAVQPTRDAFVGGAARTVSMLAHLAPRIVDLVSERTLFAAQLGPKPPSAGDNLWNGCAEAKVRGDHQGSTIRPSLYSNAAIPHGLRAMATAVTATGSALLRTNPPADPATGPSSLPPYPTTQAPQIDGGSPRGEQEGGSLSNGLNARPKHESIAQSAAGFPNDTSPPIEISADEERRIAERIRAL